MPDDIHVYRDRIASKLSDFDIWNEVVINVLQLKATMDDKVDLLVQALPDLSKALTHIQYCYQNGYLSEKDYRSLLNRVLLKKMLTKSDHVHNRLANYLS